MEQKVSNWESLGFVICLSQGLEKRHLKHRCNRMFSASGSTKLSSKQGKTGACLSRDSQDPSSQSTQALAACLVQQLRDTAGLVETSRPASHPQQRSQYVGKMCLQVPKRVPFKTVLIRSDLQSVPGKSEGTTVTRLLAEAADSG